MLLPLVVNHPYLQVPRPECAPPCEAAIIRRRVASARRWRRRRRRLLLLRFLLGRSRPAGAGSRSVLAGTGRASLAHAG